MKIKELSGKTANVGAPGFSLIELLIVVAILGILSIAVGMNINSAKTKLKTFVFNTKTRFNQAKFEAIKRSRDVYLDFDFDGDGNVSNDNGFTIWVDEDGDGDYDAAKGDEIVGTPVVFASDGSGPVIYNGAGVYPTGGPKDPNGGPKGLTIGDGVSAGGDRFKFNPNGDSAAGAAYFYFPQGATTERAVMYGPFAIIVNTVGRVRIVEWKSAGYGWEN